MNRRTAEALAESFSQRSTPITNAELAGERLPVRGREALVPDGGDASRSVGVFSGLPSCHTLPHLSLASAAFVSRRGGQSLAGLKQ